MNAIINDNRTEEDKRDDLLWNKLCRKANLNPVQQMTVSRYVDDLLRQRMTEVESAVEMGYIIALNEVLGFGTKRIKRVQSCAADNIEKTYSAMSFNGTSKIATYDGCAMQRLKAWCKSIGIEYDRRNENE